MKKNFPESLPTPNGEGEDAAAGVSFSEADLITAGYLKDQPTPEEEAILKDVIRTALSFLNPREAEFVRKHYFDGETFEQIADDNGISHVRVGQIIHRAEKKMRRRLGSDLVKLPFDKRPKREPQK